MKEMHHFTRVEFTRFKAFKQYSLALRPFNVLVGPNNAGKSTVLAAFRILSVGLRRALSKKPEVVIGPNGETRGYRVDLRAISVADENIFYNYDSNRPATVVFTLSNGNSLTMYFERDGLCVLLAHSQSPCVSPTTFGKQFNCPIGFAPILGPVDHNEQLFDKETARRALLNYTASRNFRNIWYHYPEKFEEFRTTLIRTWPGMDIERPKLVVDTGTPRLYMFCPEERIPREICWAGFGFQVWCQMLTHVIQASDKSLFLIDEPDIYLHSDLQRQLLGLLRNLGPDILLATHSTEIISEAEPDDILVIDKKRETAKRIKDPSQLSDVFLTLGSNLNPILTQLAKTRRAVFVEGKDFQILSRFALRLGVEAVGSRSHFAVIPVQGFNPQRIKHLKEGIEATLGSKIKAGAILDRDYRSNAERESIKLDCDEFCNFTAIHSRKEIENFLLVPAAIDRAASRKLADRAKRSGVASEYRFCSLSSLEEFATEKKEYVLSQHLMNRRRFELASKSGTDEATYNELVLREFNQSWEDREARFACLPGKDAVKHVNMELQHLHSVSITPTAIIEAMRRDEIPAEMVNLIDSLKGMTTD